MAWASSSHPDTSFSPLRNTPPRTKPTRPRKPSSTARTTPDADAFGLLVEAADNAI